MRGAPPTTSGSLLPLDATDPNQRTMTGASNKPFDPWRAGFARLGPASWRAMFVDAGVRARRCRTRPIASGGADLAAEHPRERGYERGRRQVLAAWNASGCSHRAVVDAIRCGHAQSLPACRPGAGLTGDEESACWR
jgi:hypothetical protein